MNTRWVASLLILLLLALGPSAALAQSTNGRLITTGAAPALSSCGTNSTIVGNDNAGKVTIGTGTPAACTLTFAVAFANAPSCYANDETTQAKNAIQATSTTTTVVLTLAAAAVTSDVISYICIGR